VRSLSTCPSPGEVCRSEVRLFTDADRLLPHCASTACAAAAAAVAACVAAVAASAAFAAAAAALRTR
jgi:ABC-type nitrate/sulfonate/bicarbonate transport system permease component